MRSHAGLVELHLAGAALGPKRVKRFDAERSTI
jgi:hypothetical protein